MPNSDTPAPDGSARSSRSFRLRAAVGPLGFVALGLLVAAATGWLWPDRTPAPTPDPDDESDPVLTVTNPGYVGIDTCAKCHAKRADEFKTTRHYLACTPASGVAAPGFAPGRGRCDTRFPGLRFEMTRSGNDCFVTAVHADGAGEQRDSFPVGLVYGSANRRDEMYFSWQDDRLVRLPVAWLYPQDRWATDVDDLRILDTHPSCLECHNTWITHIPGTPIRYRREDMHLGVTCERCHGPGREHAAYHRDHPKDESHAILHPGTLSRERLMDLCAQCHGNTRMRRSPFSYRPGQPLESCYHTARAKFREDDTTTNQVQYLGESKCFRNSTMTCITCHDPHRPTSARDGCMQCHTAASCSDQPRQPAAVCGDCVGCHMPQHIWMNSHFYRTAADHYLPVAPRSEHRIAVYPEARQAVILAWLRKQDDPASRAEANRVAGQLTGHWLNEAEQLRKAVRLKAAIGAYREALQITPNPVTRARMQEVIKRQVELDDLVARSAEAEQHNPDEAVRLLKRILEIRPDDARGHGDLGRIYSLMGRRDEATPHLQAVAKCDPNDSSGLTRLAWMASVEGRPEEAVSLCAKADRIEPGHPENHFVWGMALARQERWADAEKHFRKTLEATPTHRGAIQGLSDALLHQGQAEEAIRFAKRAVRLSDPKDASALLPLAEAYAAARRFPDARKTLEKALAIAETSDPALAGMIRDRLRALP